MPQLPYVVATTPDTEMLLLFLIFISAVPRCASAGQVTNHQSAVSGARAATERADWVSEAPERSPGHTGQR